MLEVLDLLCIGEMSRDRAASWAMRMFDDEAVECESESVLVGLKRLGSVDLPSTDRELLYGRDDFDAWKQDVIRE
jgi:hypothetical protein